MRPGSLALVGLTWPAPVAKRSAGESVWSTMMFFPRLWVSAEVMMAERMAAGVQSGWELLSRAEMPLRWGQDMEVPEIMLNVAVVGAELLSTWNGQAARMLTPGPMMSGLRMPGVWTEGPLDEKDVTAGAVLTPKMVPLNSSAAVGTVLEFM
uniref:Uncharacterized protein n=1 Tax=Kalanchoe fedtschenkoi TaxID=63787 RepID=A0A7N0V6X1_KALFE